MLIIKKKNAFTLVELLSVIVILGITFMFVMPSVSDYSIAVIRSEKSIRIRAGLTPAIELNDSTYN